MKRVLFMLALGGALIGCAGENEPAAAARLDEAKPVGSSGAAPATTEAAAPAGDASGASATKTAAAPAEDDADSRDVTIPAGTMLPLTLRSPVASDTSSVEDPVRATLRRPITIGGTQVLPAGTVVTGHVTDAARSARVKGRGRVAFRFNRIDLPGDGGQMPIRTGTVTRIAPGTKKQDAAKIGVGAAGGAIVGGIVGGGDGAAKGAAVGGGAGTAVVLATRGKEVRLGAGAPVSVRLTAPLTVRVR
jgi:hypothetical protein